MNNHVHANPLAGHTISSIPQIMSPPSTNLKDRRTKGRGAIRVTADVEQAATGLKGSSESGKLRILSRRGSSQINVHNQFKAIRSRLSSRQSSFKQMFPSDFRMSGSGFENFLGVVHHNNISKTYEHLQRESGTWKGVVQHPRSPDQLEPLQENDSIADSKALSSRKDYSAASEVLSDNEKKSHRSRQKKNPIQMPARKRVASKMLKEPLVPHGNSL